MEEKETELMLKTYRYLQHKGFVGTFSEFIENVFIPIRTFGKDDAHLKNILEIFKAAIEATEVQEESPVEIFEEVQSFIKPFSEYLTRRDLEELRKKIPDPVEWLKKAKEMSLILAGKSAFDLKLEEMRQSHDIDMEKIRWEKEKFLLQQKADKEKWDKIAGMFSPIFAMPEVKDAIKKMDKLRFDCPKCGARLVVSIPPSINIEEIPIKCPVCETITLTDPRKPEKAE